MARSGSGKDEPEGRRTRRRTRTKHGRRGSRWFWDDEQSRWRKHEKGADPQQGWWNDPANDPAVRQLEEIDDSRLSQEERALLDARRSAERKVALFRELVKGALIVVPLMIFLPFAGVIALLFMFVKFGRQAYSEFAEPQLRDRLVRDEVDKRIDRSSHAQRREMEDEHARSLEKLSASIAHEIRNPITAAKSLVQQMGEEPEAADNVEYAQVALAELERVERSVTHLLRYARDEETRAVDVKLAEIVESAAETFRERAERSGIEVERRFDSDGAIQGDPEQLRRIVINLVGNAIDALEDANLDAPLCRIEVGDNLAGTEVWLRIRDNGVGMDAETRARLFDPFYTQKGGGTGLGLSITKKLVEAHGGSIELMSELGEGAEFVVTFPKRGRETAPGTQRPQAQAQAQAE